MLQVKLYSFAGTLIDTISPNTLIGNLSWSSQINGGQGELRVKLNMPINSIIDADIIRVFSTDAFNPSGTVVYTGIITKIGRELNDNKQYIELTSLGLATVMGFKLFTNGAKTGTLSGILSNAIDSINASYPLYTKVITSLATTGNFDFQYKSILDVVNTIKQSGWSWHIDGKGNFIWKDKSSQFVHNLAIGKNIEQISIIDNAEQIKNKVSITWSGGVVTTQDSASITEYGVREYYESKTDITDATYANTYATSKLLGFSRTLNIQVYNYDIYSIIPGQLITVKNSPIDIQKLQIYKVSYSNNKATIEVEKIDSIANSVRK